MYTYILDESVRQRWRNFVRERKHNKNILFPLSEGDLSMK